jgi:hypothetical protein
MTLALDRHQGLLSEEDEQIGLECPYCNVYSHMTPQAIPAAADLIEARPKHVGLVYQCDSCDAPVFLRFATKSFTEDRNFNAFASMCRRTAVSAYAALGEGGKLRAFEDVMVAQDIAGIDDEAFAPIRTVMFDAGGEEQLPLLNRVQAGILLEVMKDMLYQCFVRRGKLTRALKVRRFFVQQGNEDLASSA